MREYVGILIVIALGGIIVVASYSATWATATVPVFAGQGATAPTRDIALTGSQLVPLGLALGWLALAGAAGLLATRTWGRRLIGAIVVLAGGGSGASALAFGLTGAALIDTALAAQDQLAATSVTRSPWWIAGMVGGLLVLIAGAVATLRGPSWPRLGKRYERGGVAPSDRSGTAESAGRLGGVAAWDALDRGEDPPF